MSSIHNFTLEDIDDEILEPIDIPKLSNFSIIQKTS